MSVLKLRSIRKRHAREELRVMPAAGAHNKKERAEAHP